MPNAFYRMSSDSTFWPEIDCLDDYKAIIRATDVAGPYVSGHLVLDYFFGTDLMSVHNFVGWMAVLATVINILPVSFAILLVVR